MSCDNVITVQDLETDKKHSTFYREVITGKAGGLSTGANIDYATNAVTGQVQKTLPATVNGIDWTPVGNLTTDNCTFTKATDYAVDDSGTQWAYNGTFPFTSTAPVVPSAPDYYVVHVKSASAISNANGGSVQDFIDAQYVTSVGLLIGNFTAGNYVRLTDRNNELFKINMGGTPNGFDILPSVGMLTAELENKSSATFLGFGAKDDLSFDSAPALNRMISVVGGIRGPRAVLAVGQSLTAVEGLFILMDDNVGANSGGVILPHSSVADPNTFDFIDASGVDMEHIELENVRFLGGRHVIRQDNTTSGMLSQFNAVGCVFQELSGYVVSSTNSFFVTDLEKCRIIRSGGFDCGFGTNLVTLRNCGFELARRELIKQSAGGSDLPSASILLENMRVEGLDVDKNAFPLINVQGNGKTFNLSISGVNYIENSFIELLRAEGVDVTVSDLFVTNSSVYTQTINIINGSLSMSGVESLVPLDVSLSNSRYLDGGDNSLSINVKLDGSSQQVAKIVTRSKSLLSPKDFLRFTTSYSGGSGATVFAAVSGILTLSFCGSKSSDGTPLYGAKTYLVTVRKFFDDNNLSMSITETGSNGSLSDVTVNVSATTITTTTLHINIGVTVGSGTLSDFIASAEFSPMSNAAGLQGISVTEL